MKIATLFFLLIFISSCFSESDDEIARKLLEQKMKKFNAQMDHSFTEDRPISLRVHPGSVKMKSYPNNFRVLKAIVASSFAGLALEHTPFNWEDRLLPEFMNVNPFHKVPTLFFGSDQKTGIFESNSILRYISRLSPAAKLYGSNNYEASLIDAFLDTEIQLLKDLGPWLYPYLYKSHTSTEEQIEESKNKVTIWLQGFEYWFNSENRKFLVGDTISIADISIFCSLIHAFEHCFDHEFLTQFPIFTQYFISIYKHPKILPIMITKQIAQDIDWEQLITKLDSKEAKEEL